MQRTAVMRLAITTPSLAVMLVAVAALGGCRSSSEKAACEAQKALATRSQKQAKASLELERGDYPAAARSLVEGQDADERAAQKLADLDEAVARERRHESALLTKEIAWVDRRIADLEKDAASASGVLQSEKVRDVLAARQWRDRLREDLEAASQPVPSADWPALKLRIESDLEENRPPSLPRSYEKPYGI